MSLFRDFFSKTELVFILSIILGLILTLNYVSWKFAVNYLLGIVMFFSIRPFFQHRFNIHEKAKYVVMSILLNYVVLSGVYVLLASLFFSNTSPYFIGFVLISLVPPAIAIVPLCYFTKCDPETADSSLFLSFLLSLIILPLTMYIIFGKSLNMWELIKILLIIIVIPGILAFFTRKSKFDMFRYTKPVTNVCLGLVLFIAVSLNKDLFFNMTSYILRVYLVVILAVFGTGFLVYYLSKRFFNKAESINFSLYASQKNVGTAIAIALLMFNPLVAVPAIIALVMQFIYFIIFERFVLKVV